MSLKKIALTVLCAGFSANVFANAVLLTADQRMDVEYQIAHKNKGGETVLGEKQRVVVKHSYPISIPLDNYDLAGVVIFSVNGHILPPTVNQFDKPEQCSMTTDKSKTTGALAFTVSGHTLSCRTFGGVYGG